MNEVKRALFFSLTKVSPTAFTVAILVDVLLSVFLQAAAPDYKIISGALGLMLLSLVGVIWATVMKKIDQNEKKASERGDKIEAELTLQVASLQKEAKESAFALTAQLTADREIRDLYHESNLLALCHIMQAMKTGDTSKLEPELLFRKRLHLKQGD